MSKQRNKSVASRGLAGATCKTFLDAQAIVSSMREGIVSNIFLYDCTSALAGAFGWGRAFWTS